MLQVGKNKGLNERGITSTLLETLSINSHVLSVSNDPPDCFFEMEGRKIGVEITILVHQKTRESHIKAKKERLFLPDYYMWTSEELIDRIQEIISIKEQKLIKNHSRNEQFDEIWLLIATDEPAITDEYFSEKEKQKTSSFSEALKQHRFISSKVFSKGYLMMSYDTNRGTYPLDEFKFF